MPLVAAASRVADVRAMLCAGSFDECGRLLGMAESSEEEVEQEAADAASEGGEEEEGRSTAKMLHDEAWLLKRMLGRRRAVLSLIGELRSAVAACDPRGIAGALGGIDGALGVEPRLLDVVSAAADGSKAADDIGNARLLLQKMTACLSSLSNADADAARIDTAVREWEAAGLDRSLADADALGLHGEDAVVRARATRDAVREIEADLVQALSGLEPQLSSHSADSFAIMARSLEASATAVGQGRRPGASGKADAQVVEYRRWLMSSTARRLHHALASSADVLYAVSQEAADEPSTTATPALDVALLAASADDVPMHVKVRLTEMQSALALLDDARETAASLCEVCAGGSCRARFLV